MTETAKVIFSVVGTGVAMLTVTLTVTLALFGELKEDNRGIRADMRDIRADMREMRGLLITHIASDHHTHLPAVDTAAANPPDIPQ